MKTKYNDLSDEEKDFVNFSDVYTLDDEEYIYDPEQEEYPSIDEIQNEITWKRKGDI